MAGHVFNASTKFEDPTAIRSRVMSSDIFHRIPLTMHASAATANAPYHVIYA